MPRRNWRLGAMRMFADPFGTGLYVDATLVKVMLLDRPRMHRRKHWRQGKIQPHPAIEFLEGVNEVLADDVRIIERRTENVE